MKEEWRDIKGYEGYYQVSNMGRVKSLRRHVARNTGVVISLKERILSPRPDRYGYLWVSLCNTSGAKPFSLHRLVAMAFLASQANSAFVVDHINRIRSDNRVTNLRWVSSSANNINSARMRNKSSRFNGVSRSHSAKKWKADVFFHGRMLYLGCFTHEQDAARAFDAFCIKHKLDRVLNYATA